MKKTTGPANGSSTPRLTDLPAFLDEEEFPALCDMLRKGQLSNIEQELAKLAERRLPYRAPRRRLLRVAHLLCEGHDEVVLIKDISRTGVRFLVPNASPIDLSTPDGLFLRVATETGLKSLPLSLVRVCEHQAAHMDAAFKFSTGDLDEALVQSLRHNIFEASHDE